MEVLNAISNFISALGVPVFCMCACFYLWNKETETHREEMEKFTEALNNNTLALTKLSDKLEVNRNDN